MPTVGARLRQARTDAGMSLHDVAERTKIQVWMLASIERDDFIHLPGGVFIRGYLCAFAREVGLDPESIAAQYRASIEPAPPDPPAAPPPTETPSAGAIRWWVWTVTAICAAALIVIVWFSSHDAPRRAAEPPAAIDESGDAVTSTRGEDAVLPVVNEDEPLIMDIHALDSVWLEAVVDRQPYIYRLLEPDYRERVAARDEIALRIGDASAFEYSINGAAGRPLGGPREVRVVRITRDNYHTFVTGRPD